MRVRLVFLVTGVLALAIVEAAGCNPIFGIVSRTQGPTWCEQQTKTAYCDDFDWILPSTTAQETPQSTNGTAAITDAEANSLPNSLVVTTTEVTGDAATLAGMLVNFGPEAQATGFPLLHCQIDLQPAELANASGTTKVRVAALGGQVPEVNPSGTPAAPEFVFVTFGPKGGVSAELTTVNTGDVLGEPLGVPCSLFGAGSASMIDKPWTTLQLSLIPLTSEPAPVDAGLPCSVGHVPEAGKDKDPRDAGARESGARPPGPSYVFVVQYGPFEDAIGVYQDFVGQPLFGYGVVIKGAAPATTLHIDNAACTAQDAGP